MAPPQPARIHKLDEAVINRIAAGEIIQRPANALKELLENALDAKATAIDIVVKDGGLKLLQITDNGTGIEKNDLAILCERFTTSKLQEFNDLTSMETYGFRGEALASITHIAHVMVTTKTEDSQCAWRAHYLDGKLSATGGSGDVEPKAVAGNRGTQIAVSDMFYNVPMRARALGKGTEEHAKLLDIVNKYAIHCEGIAMTCKKHGDATSSVLTTTRNSRVDSVRSIYGSAVANDLLAISLQDEEVKCKMNGLITSTNYHAKKLTLLLFVNNRLVESTSLKKAIESTYTSFTAKDAHPFVYLSLHIDPARLDINVHPTKREIHILDEEQIIVEITSSISSRLSENDHVRTYKTQTLLPGAPLDACISSEKIRRNNNLGSSSAPATFVRTDSKQQKLLNIVESRPRENPKAHQEESTAGNSEKTRTEINLASVKALRTEVRQSVHEDLTAIFSEHVFVGVVDLDRRLAAVQHLTKLYLIDYGAVSAELFYQIGLAEFGNFGSIRLDPPLKVEDLLKLAYKALQSRESGEEIMPSSGIKASVKDTLAQLTAKREMLLEYFSIDIDTDGILKGIPLLMHSYIPSLSKLPNFLMRLGTKVDWQTEQACFSTFLRELALFYVPEILNSTIQSRPPKALKTARDEANNIDTRKASLEAMIENVLFPAFKRRLIAPKSLAAEKRICQIANLPDLYKTFERC